MSGTLRAMEARGSGAASGSIAAGSGRLAPWLLAAVVYLALTAYAFGPLLGCLDACYVDFKAIHPGIGSFEGLSSVYGSGSDVALRFRLRLNGALSLTGYYGEPWLKEQRVYLGVQFEYR